MSLSLVSHLLEDLKASTDITQVFNTIVHQRLEDVVTWADPSAFDALFVAQGNESAEPNQTDGPFAVNYTTSEIHIVIVAEIENLDDRKARMRNVVHGWQHQSNQDVLQFSDGEVFHQVGEYLFWVDTYTTRYEIRSM